MRSNAKITNEMMEAICDRLAEGRSLRSICRDEDIGVASSSVRQWIMRNADSELASQYLRARDLGIDEMAEEIMEIADDGTNDFVEKERKDGSTYVGLDAEHVQRSKLRVDSRKWYVSKLAPKRYGDRIQTDVTSSDGSLKGMSQDEIAHKLNTILEAAQKRKEAAEKATDDDAKRKQEALDELL